MIETLLVLAFIFGGADTAPASDVPLTPAEVQAFEKAFQEITLARAAVETAQAKVATAESNYQRLILETKLAKGLTAKHQLAISEERQPDGSVRQVVVFRLPAEPKPATSPK